MLINNISLEISVKEKIADGLQSLRSLIFGLEDGIVSILGLVLGVSAATQNSFLVILAGIAGALPAALSMGAGDFLSSKSKMEVQRSNLEKISKKALRNNKILLKELEKKYLSEGFKKAEIQPWLNALSKNKELLVRKYSEECGCIPESFENPSRNALTIVVAFLFGSLVTLLPFFFLPVSTAQSVCFVTASLMLFAIGAVKTKFTQVKWWKSGIEMLVIGLSAAVIGYLIGIGLGG